MLGTLREGNQFHPGSLQVADEGKWKLPKDYA